MIVSASIGGGHDGAAAELARRLDASGASTRVVDFLRLLPPGFGPVVRVVYRWQLRFAPWSYELLYRIWFLIPMARRPLAWFHARMCGRGLTPLIASVQPDVVVSVYPLASLALGHLRAKGTLHVPVVTYLTDFSVHPLWIHPAVDLHLALTPATAAAAERLGAPVARSVGPLVRDGFDGRGDRRQLRRQLGIPEDVPAVLVVAGSWGVGSVPRTVAAITAAGSFHPVTVCGRNASLKRRIERRCGGTVMGWTDQMRDVMAACDAVVENAGGLTSLEAFASGLPVVTYRPIAGHGRHNAKVMSRQGVSRYAHNRDDLVDALTSLTAPTLARARAISAGRALFTGDAVTAIEAMVRPQVTSPAEPARLHVARRIGAAAAAIVAVYGFLTLGVGAATAHGLGVTRAGPDRLRPNIVGIRLDSALLADPRVVAGIASSGTPVVLDAVTASSAATALQALAARDVDVLNDGSGERHWFALAQAVSDKAGAADIIRSTTGESPGPFVACRRVTAFDLAAARTRPRRTILEPVRVRVDKPLNTLKPHRLYVLDARGASVATTLDALDTLDAAVRGSRVAVLDHDSQATSG